jgi:hypothetical protein
MNTQRIASPSSLLILDRQIKNATRRRKDANEDAKNSNAELNADRHVSFLPLPSHLSSRFRALAAYFSAFAIIAIAIIGRVGMIAWPFLNDSGLYVQLGRTVATGAVLYRDFFETKLPGAGLLASAFWRAFGTHWFGYVLCQLTMTFIAATALAHAVRRNIGSWPATFLFAVVFLNLAQAVYTGFQLETIQAFFEALAAMAAIESIRRDDCFSTFTTGLAAGMAAMAKPGGMGVAVALLIVLSYRRRRRMKNITSLFTGLMIPTAATLFFTFQSGAWPYLPGVLLDIQQYVAGTPMRTDALFKLLVVIGLLSFPFALRRKIFARFTPQLLFAIAWFSADLIAAVSQRRMYPYHFLPLACPAALLYGMLPGRAKPMSVALGLLPIALLSLTWEGSSISNLHRGFEHLPASDYIIAHTTANDSVFSDQIGRLLIETDRKPGSRLGTFFYFVNSDNAPRQYCQILLTDFESRKPKYLVLPGDWDRPVPGLANCDILKRCPQRRENFIAAWAMLREYVARHYHVEAKIDGVLIYRRDVQTTTLTGTSRFEHPANASTGSRTPPGRSVDRSPQTVQADPGD